MKVLIVGGHGAAGSYLAERVAACVPKHEIILSGREYDLRTVAISRLIESARPDYVFHLASMAKLPDSFKDPYEFTKNNVLGTLNLFEACQRYIPKARILMVSSCEVYGNAKEMPIVEEAPMRPLSPYAVSKCAQEHLATMYHDVYGMHIVISRLFNYINPRREDLFASAWAKQIALIEAGKQPPEITVGNLDSARTLLDGRDVVRGYWMLLEHGEPGQVYNIGDTEEVKLRDVLKILLHMAKVKIHVRQDPALIRPIDIPTQIADATRFVEVTGWQPNYTVPESLEWLLDTMRKKYV